MNPHVIEWGAGPPKRPQGGSNPGRSRASQYDALLETLKQKPGAWALCGGAERPQSLADGLRGVSRRRHLPVEVIRRDQEVWARWVGSHE